MNNLIKKHAVFLLFSFSFFSQNIFADGSNCPSVETFKMQNIGSVSARGNFNNKIFYDARGASFNDSNHTWRILYQFETPGTSNVDGVSRANEIRANIHSGYATTLRQDEVNEWYCLYQSSADSRALIMASYDF